MRNSLFPKFVVLLFICLILPCKAIGAAKDAVTYQLRNEQIQRIGTTSEYQKAMEVAKILNTALATTDCPQIPSDEFIPAELSGAVCFNPLWMQQQNPLRQVGVEVVYGIVYFPKNQAVIYYLTVPKTDENYAEMYGRSIIEMVNSRILPEETKVRFVTISNKQFSELKQMGISEWHYP